MKKIYTLLLIMLVTLLGCSSVDSVEEQSPEEQLARTTMDAILNLQATEYSVNYNGSDILVKINSKGDYTMELVGQDIVITYVDGQSYYCYGEDLCTSVEDTTIDIHDLIDTYVSLVDLGELESQDGDVLTFSNGDIITVDLENESIIFGEMSVKVVDDFDVELPE